MLASRPAAGQTIARLRTGTDDSAFASSPPPQGPCAGDLVATFRGLAKVG